MSWRLYCGTEHPRWADDIVTEANAVSLSEKWLGEGPMGVYTESLDNAAFLALGTAWYEVGWDMYSLFVWRGGVWEYVNDHGNETFWLPHDEHTTA